MKQVRQMLRPHNLPVYLYSRPGRALANGIRSGRGFARARFYPSASRPSGKRRALSH
jgi:hypothetical protein